jgi:hypothetical protein
LAPDAAGPSTPTEKRSAFGLLTISHVVSFRRFDFTLSHIEAAARSKNDGLGEILVANLTFVHALFVIPAKAGIQSLPLA